MTTTPDAAQYMSEDVVLAAIDLVDRTGGSGFELGYLHDDVPVHKAAWYAFARYRGTRITVQEQASPTGAALALAERLLAGAACRCGGIVSLSDATPGCRWRLTGPRWEPGCDAPSIDMPGSSRGDVGELTRMMQQRHQQQRRAPKGRKRKGRR